MIGVGAMVPGGTHLAIAAPTFQVPSPAGQSGTGTPESPARFAGVLAHWLRVPPGVGVSAFARSSRRVYRQLAPGLPDGTPSAGVLVELSPLPGFLAGALRQLAGGLPVQYVLLSGADGEQLATPDEDTVVAVEEPLLTPAGECWLAVCFQDRICLDPRGWVQAIDAAAQAGGVLAGAGWAAFVAAVTTTAGARVRLLDHSGQPLRSGSVQITTGGATHDVTLTSASDGDSGVDVAAGAAEIVVAGADGSLLASADSDTGSVGGPLALTDTDRHVLVSDTDEWLAARSSGVTGMPRWTTGNTIEPIIDGIPYFTRLVPDLRAAKGGGAVQFAGWDFVMEGLQDKTKPWSLLPEDNSTEILALIGELIEHEAQVQVLVTQFLEIDQEGLMALRDDVAVALVLIVILLGTLDFAQWLTTDTAGWVLLGAGLTLIPGLPDSLLRDALVAIAEPSKDTVEAINSAHPGTAVWTPYPASLADNPLAPDPLTIAAVPVEEVVNHVGVYHHKIAMVKATQADPIAYLGGIDIDPDRVDDPLHRAAAPFHDIQVRLTGPAVNEVAKTYAERAAYHGASAPIAPAADSTALSGTGPHVVQVGRTYFAPAAGSTSQPLPSAPQGEHTTHDTLLQAIANAREYIYIEDQYFTPDTEFVEALVAAGAPERGLRGLVITLVQDNGQLFGALRRDDIIHRLAESWQERFRVGTPLRRYLNPEPGTFGGLGRMVLRMEAKVGDEELVLGPATRCPTPPFWAFVESELVYVESIVPNGAGTGPIGPQDPGSPDPADQTWQKVQVVRGPEGDNPRWGAKPDHHDKGSCVLAVQVPEIYVHAKLMVVDDVFLSVGSTNFNRRSLEHDGEIHTFTLPASLKRDPTNPALRVRCRVWAEHFGLPPEMGLSLLADPVSALAYFDRSWYRGSRWQPLRWTTAGQAPAIAIPTVGNILLQLLAIAEGALLDDEKSPIWAAMVDPTTANDPHVDPATDRGPLL